MSKRGADYTLTKPSDQELSDLVAILLCGWELGDDGRWVRPGGTTWNFKPNFAQNETSAIWVLEDTKANATIRRTDGRWTVEIGDDITGEAPTLAPAICIAVLRAAGVSIYGV